MTKQELNRDIKRLANEIYRISFDTQEKYFEYLEKEAKKEFIRLYNADRNFEYMNGKSVLIMLKLNLTNKFIPLHTFGLNIDITKLI